MLNSTKLIQSVRRRAMVPEDTSVYNDEDILEIANEEVATGLMPLLLSLNEEHLVVVEDVPLTPNTTRYKIPYRAIGNKLRDVALIRKSGDVHELSRISLEELSDYDNAFASSYEQLVFYVQGNEICFIRSPDGSYESIRFYYYLRPSNLVEQDRIGTITAIDITTGTLTLDNVPSEFLTEPKFDFVSSKTPNKILKFDVTVAQINETSNIIVFNELPQGLNVGDYVCIAEETFIPPVPIELHPILAQKVAIHILEGLGDSEGLQNAEKKLAKMEKNVSMLLDDRVEGAPRKIGQRNTPLLQSVFTNTRRRYRRF